MKLVFLCLFSLPLFASQMLEKVIIVDDEKRFFDIYVPPGARATHSELIIDFRGFFKSAETRDLVSELNIKANSQRRIKVYPRSKTTQTTPWSFKDEHEVRFTEKIVDFLLHEYGSKKADIYMQGYPTWPLVPFRIALEHPHLIFEPTKRGELKEFQTSFKNENRRYSVFIPHKWRVDKKRKWDVVFDFTGYFFTPYGVSQVGQRNQKANYENKIVVYPRAGKSFWQNKKELKAPFNLGTEIEFAEFIYKELQSSFNLTLRPLVSSIGFFPLISFSHAKRYPRQLALPFYEGKVEKLSLNLKSGVKEVLVYVPNVYPLADRPAIIDFRKLFSPPAEQETSIILNNEATRTGHYFVYPHFDCSLDHKYREETRIEITEKLVVELVSKYDINDSRIFITGHSSDSVSSYPTPLAELGKGRVIKHVTQANGKQRKDSVFLPHNYLPNSSEKRPMILDYHAFFIMPVGQMAMTGMNEEANRRGYVVAYPRAGIGIWNNGNEIDGPIKDFDDVGFSKVVIKEMIQKYNVDPERIYITGYSSGALMAYRSAVELPHLIAAFSAVGGSLNVDVDLDKSLPVPLMHIHGVYDGIVPLLRDGINGINSATDSVNTWTDVNKTTKNPEVSKGVLKAPYKKIPFKINFKRLSYEPVSEDGAMIEFYQLKNTFHIFPISMHRYTNPRMLDFFSRYKRVP